MSRGRHAERALRLVTDAVPDGPETPREGGDPSRGGMVHRALHGDTDAFELVYRAYGADVYAICLRMAGDATAARELVQDVFVRAWEKRELFRGESAFGTWLHRLAVNVVLNRFRADNRRWAYVMPQSDLVDWDAPGRNPSPDDQMDIEGSLSRLSPGPRVAFVLHHVEGYSYEEIADVMHLAEGTVRAHVFRARQQLMRMLS